MATHSIVLLLCGALCISDEAGAALQPVTDGSPPALIEFSCLS